MKNTGTNSYRRQENIIEIASGRQEVSPYSSRKHISTNTDWCSDEQTTKREEEKKVRIQ